ncbi:hypothetical protein D1BOALGB6SA_9364 [Olavius sp. associated proteobacterium Delta 1]|nr:hypothetical protein D1BOALGB6SA_9364 [Olavius sp. associated proteobacterium Delta 1]
MNILMIAINDPAGTAILFTKAINRYTEHTCRLITKETRYNHLFEKDLHLPWLDDKDWNEVEHLLTKSDIIHFHMTADESLQIGPFKLKDYITNKSIVHHHHGHPDFRSNPHKYRDKYKALNRQNLIVSTPDLLKMLPEARWVPNLVPINNALYLPQRALEKGGVVLGQSPTRKGLKNTSELLHAINQINQNGTPHGVQLNIIENTPHRECLKRKNACHIIFDHMQGYYGVSSLESLSQGKPVIAGLDDWNIHCIKEFTGADKLPWINARNQKQLAERLQMLVPSSDRRKNIGMESRLFMENRWSEQKVLKKLFEGYATL